MKITGPTIAALEQKFLQQTDGLGPPDDASQTAARKQLVDARLEIGRKLLSDPTTAESVGLDPSNALIAKQLQDELLTELPKGSVEAQILETCIAGLAGGVSADSMFEHFESRGIVSGLQIVDSAIRLVIDYEREMRATQARFRPNEDRERAELRRKFGEEPPVRVRTLGETLLIANEQAKEQLGPGEHANALAEVNTAISELLKKGDLEALREQLPALLDKSEQATTHLAATDPALQPKEPDAAQKAKLDAWKSTNARAEMALHFIRTAGPVERASVLRQLAQELEVPASAIAHYAA